MKRLEQKPLIHRAFEFARSPGCKDIRSIRSALKPEGYTHNEIAAHLLSKNIRSQLKALQMRTGVATAQG
jgi:hypothetical protein